MTITAAEAPELAEFRLKVRSFLTEHAPKRAARGDDESPAFEATVADLATQKVFQAALADAGLAGLTWPTPWGQGLTPEHQRVFNEEAAGYELPTTAYIIGLGMVIPTMIEFGTDAQRERYVAKALRGEEIWSQLFSEPGAGSDVASLQMRAERDGDEWVLNGQKVWTTGAQLSDFGAVIARTNPDNPKHRGITMFIVDFKAPGVEIRPLRQMNGGSGFNEVFFTDVRIPDANRIGDVDDGWRCAVAMLMNERVAIGSGGGGGRRRRCQAAHRARTAAGRARRPRRSPGPRRHLHPDADHGLHRAAHARRGDGWQGTGTRGLDRQARGRPAGATLVRSRHRPRRCRRSGVGGPAGVQVGARRSCPLPRPASPAAPTRCSATSSANACSGCRRSPRLTATSRSRS